MDGLCSPRDGEFITLLSGAAAWSLVPARSEASGCGAIGAPLCMTSPLTSPPPSARTLSAYSSGRLTRLCNLRLGPITLSHPTKQHMTSQQHETIATVAWHDSREMCASVLG
jgi:hypothetical protein